MRVVLLTLILKNESFYLMKVIWTKEIKWERGRREKHNKFLNINLNWKETVSENGRNKDIFQKIKFKTVLRSKTPFW